MSDSRPSYLNALSPSYFYADLNASLEAQVLDIRKNLMEALKSRRNSDDDYSGDSSDVGEEPLKVFLRIRPLTPQEATAGEENCFFVKNEATVCATAPPDSWSYRNAQHLGAAGSTDFGFSRVFNTRATQEQVFESTALDLVKEFATGHNVLMFSYGVTSAGKTYTIQGSEKNPGIIPRTLACLFTLTRDDLYADPCFHPKFVNEAIVAEDSEKQTLQHKKESLMRLADADDFESLMIDSNLTKISSGSETSLTSSCSSNSDAACEPSKKSMECVENVGGPFLGFKYLIWISFAEIYNEFVYDLFEILPNGKNKRRNVLKVSEDKKGNVYVKGLTEINVINCEEALKLLSFGQKNLRFASTKMNYNSSRSHCVYTVRLMRLTCHGDQLFMDRSSKFSFCDLAGSERTSKTGSTGERLKEAGNINTSLLNLGRCISTLRYNQCHKEKSQIIPFRDSKLTRLFQNFLVGRGKACMVVNISPCASSFDETWQVLQFSALVKLVKQAFFDKNANNNALGYGPMCRMKQSASHREQLERIVEQASATPLPGDMADDEDSVFETTTVAADNEIVEKLQLVIDDLKAQLLAERRKNLRIEQSVREEMCEKFAAQLMEKDAKNSEALERQLDRAEDVADERIELYVQTIKKHQNNVARRLTMGVNEVSDEEEEAWVPETVLRAERVENHLLRQQLACESGRVSIVHPADAASMQISNCLAENVALKDEISKLTVELEKKITECKDLDEMLDKAGTKFTEEQVEIAALKSEISRINQNYANVIDQYKADLTLARSEFAELKSQFDATKDCRMSDHQQFSAHETSAAGRQEPPSGDSAGPAAVTSTQSTSSSGSGNGQGEEVGAGAADGGFKLIELESKIFELENNAEALHRENDHLRCSEKASAEKVTNLEKQLAAKNQVTLSSGQLRSQLQSSERRVEELDKLLKESTSKESKLKSEKRKLDEDLRQKSASLQHMQDEKQEWVKKEEELKKECSNIGGKFDSLNKEKQEVSTKLAHLEEQQGKMQAERADLRKRLDEEVSGGRERKAKVDRELTELKVEMEQLKIAQKQAEHLKENLANQKSAADLALEQLKADFTRKEAEQEEHRASSQASFDALKRTLEMSHQKFMEKTSQLTQVESENKLLAEKLVSLEKSHVKEAAGVENIQKLQMELDTAKQQVLDLKKEKLTVSESLTKLDSEFKSNKNTLVEIVSQLNEEKKNNQRIIEDSRKNEQLLNTFKLAISNQESVQAEMQKALTARNQEMAHLNEEVKILKVRAEKAESGETLAQKDCLRMKTEVEMRKELEAKMKITIESLKADINARDVDIKTEKKKCAELEQRANQKFTDESSGSKRVSKDHVKNIAALEQKLEHLAKELIGKETLVESLNEKLSEKEKAYALQEKSLAKMEASHNQVLANMERSLEVAKFKLNGEIEALRQEKSALEHKLLGTKDVVEKPVLVDKKTAEESGKKITATLPPMGGRRRAKVAATLDDEDTNEVELTPMVSKKMSQLTASRTSQKAELISQPETFDDPDFFTHKAPKSSTRGLSASKSQKLQETQVPAASTSSSVPKGPGRPKGGRGRRPTVKAVGVLTDESSPITITDPLTIQTDAFDTPFFEKLAAGSSTVERLSRRAKSNARNGIFAATQYWRNSPVSPTSSAPLKKVDIFDDLDDQLLPPKKRRRNLYKSPEAGLLKTPPASEFGTKSVGRKSRRGK